MTVAPGRRRDECGRADRRDWPRDQSRSHPMSRRPLRPPHPVSARNRHPAVARRHMMQQRREPFLLPQLGRCPYALQTGRHVFPARCPAHAVLARVLLGPAPTKRASASALPVPRGPRPQHACTRHGGIAALKPKPNGGRKHENMTVPEEKALLARRETGRGVEGESPLW